MVPASNLSLKDDFLKHIPNSIKEWKFKKAVKKVIKAGVRDFYRPTIDPSYDENGHICYKAGMHPATASSYNWWDEYAKKYCPERKSRLGTRSEYIAFLAVLIKEMVASGKSLKWAWNAVCNDSEELGNYSKSIDLAFEEDTGSREVCGWYDLGNTGKLLAEDKAHGGYWIASGDCYCKGNKHPLACLYHDYNRRDYCDSCTGWLVLS